MSKNSKVTYFRETYLQRLHTYMSQCNSVEVRQYKESLQTKHPYEQIRTIFHDLPLLYGHTHMTLLEAMTEALGSVVEECVVTILKEEKCTSVETPSLFCGPRVYQLNRHGELELTVDLSVTCSKTKVLFVSVKCTKYDLICDSSLRFVYEDMVQQLKRQLVKGKIVS
ncbi:hypothetical protein [Metabacillus iocasae]|uniref:Uncharacterized protein n=1 Tax=Priestia iocasae TaxID=2291674 RepID=A0ABS2QW45_9BACI|nr:hypothetical protein [Metabacillus iocasae]MBM7703167.1 hypothetical protein [Metabacillus iocasae]